MSGERWRAKEVPLFQRYFVLDTGILKYGKSPGDLSKGKVHGSVDIGLSVISTKSKRKRIDIDAEEFIYHLKVRANEGPPTAPATPALMLLSCAGEAVRGVRGVGRGAEEAPPPQTAPPDVRERRGRRGRSQGAAVPE